MDGWRRALAVGLCVGVAACKPSAGTPPAEPDTSGGSGGATSVNGGSGGKGLPFQRIDGGIFDPGEGGVRLRRASKVDLLVVVDDSISMGDKHSILKEAVPDLLLRLVNPVCTEKGGFASQPASPSDPCPNNMEREFKPIDDLHVGMITSSLGGFEGGSSQCGVPIGEPGNDGAHLFPSLPRGNVAGTYSGSGFFKWDRAQVSSPPGESDLNRLFQSFSAAVEAVGEVGCGYESTLESWFRFLVDPEPLASVTYAACDDAGTLCLKNGPVDSVVLSQRRAFLRPDSLLVILMLTDEDDCSIPPEQTSFLAKSRVAPRASSACAQNPDDPCCYPCAGFGPPPAGCSPDPACDVNQGRLTNAEDQVNLTCFQPKRRFGIDPRYPTQRYVDALRQRQIRNRAGELVDNPIFAGGRSKDEVFLVGVVGVPWQDVATEATLKDPRQLRIKSAKELRQTGGWDVILGDGKTPGDPFMLPSIVPRSGTNPVTGDAIAPPSAPAMANPINGHERNVTRQDDHQYSCIFPLVVPKVCDRATGSCACNSASDGSNDPLCQETSGAYTNTQRYAKAYPPLRILSVMKQLEDSAVVSSICPRNVDDKSREDYGYRAVIGATIDDVAPYLIR